MKALVDAGDGVGFEKFTGKIDAHSKFEDEQLFKFFKENDESCKAAIDELEAEHAQLDISKTVFDAIKAGDGIKEALQKYAEHMLEHLSHEENTLVHRWLNLSPEE